MRRIPSPGVDTVVRAPAAVLQGVPEVLFSQGALVVERSGPWTCRQDALAYEVVVALGTAGTTDTVVSFEVNLIDVGGAVTLAAGVTSIVVAAGLSLFVDERLTVNVTSAGAGASHLTIQVRLSYG